MESYNATLEFGKPATAANFGALMDAFAEFHPAAGRSLLGRSDVTITLPAETIAQAVQLALGLAAGAHLRPVALQILTTADFDLQNGLEPVPDLLSVTEVAAELGVTRQAVLQRIESGSLPSTKVGTAYAIPRSAIGLRNE